MFYNTTLYVSTNGIVLQYSVYQNYAYKWKNIPLIYVLKIMRKLRRSIHNLEMISKTK